MSMIQFTTWIVVVVTLIADAIWVSRNKSKWYYSISIVVLSLHAFIFYLAVYIDGIGFIDIHDLFYNKALFSDWSSILRLHSFITICSMELARIPAPKFFKTIVHIFKNIGHRLKGAHG